MTDTGPDAETVDQIVAELRQDPILVHQLLGNGHTDEVTSGLRELADQVGVPVFVALVQRPPGLAAEDPSDDLLRVVHAHLDEPGIYIVQVQDGLQQVGAYDVPVESVKLSLARYDAVDLAVADLADSVELSAAGEAALTLRAAAEPGLELSRPEVREIVGDDTWLTSTSDEPSPYDLVGDPLTPLVVAVAAGLTAAVIAWRLLRARAAGSAVSVGEAPGTLVPRGTTRTTLKTRGQTTFHDLESLRRRMRTDLRTLEQALGDSGAPPTRLDAARACLDVAGELAESDDPLEVVGALVLARTGQAALSSGPWPFRPCFFNPLHDAARSQVRAAAGGGSVPTCNTCADIVVRGDEPRSLIVGNGFWSRPYYRGSSVWARTGYGSLVDDLWDRVATRETR